MSEQETAAIVDEVAAETKEAAAAKKKTVKKAPVKKVAAKKAAKKSTKKAPKKKAAKTESTPRGESVRSRVFKLLAKHPNGLTGVQIREKLELTAVQSMLRAEGDAEKPRVRLNEIEGVRGTVYTLTAAGKHAVEKGTVDSGKP